MCVGNNLETITLPKLDFFYRGRIVFTHIIPIVNPLPNFEKKETTQKIKRRARHSNDNQFEN